MSVLSDKDIETMQSEWDKFKSDYEIEIEDAIAFDFGFPGVFCERIINLQERINACIKGKEMLLAQKQQDN